MKTSRARLLKTVKERELADALERLSGARDEALDLEVRIAQLDERIASLGEAVSLDPTPGTLSAGALESASLARDAARERIARYEKERREISVELGGAVARRDAAAEEAGNARRALANLDGVLRDLPE